MAHECTCPTCGNRHWVFQKPAASVLYETPPKPLPLPLSFLAAAGDLDLGGKETGFCVVCQKSCESIDGAPRGRLLMKRYPGGWRRAGVVCEPHALDLRALFP